MSQRKNEANSIGSNAVRKQIHKIGSLENDSLVRTNQESEVLRHCYQDSPQDLVERLKRIQKIATFHSDTDCWPNKKGIYGGFVEDLFFLDELIESISRLPKELPEGKSYYK